MSAHLTDDELERYLAQKRRDYKDLHRGTAKSKGVEREFLAAETCTEMRKVLWGHKKKHKKRSV